ncbi:ralA-binding protein 1 [Lutzomyia longipalpis]|uniref:ralA-binding protein 1 n=1 Tax=Lutzomyia longipalpis TaxID=7200 RepID=UPI0024841596|nr:ralA-binding protein 1 [Lutzomyia longipalpis]
MEFESPDVEKEFPGLYASQARTGEDVDDGEGGRSARRRDRKKDKGYATLSGDSSPEKERKRKAFKFTPKVHHIFPWCRPQPPPPAVGNDATTPPLPEDPAEVAAELERQERLLEQLHEDIRREGSVDREEQLWAVQRTVTHLKRRLRQSRMQWNADVHLLLPHTTHPDAEEVVKLQLENRHLMALAERLVARLRDATEEVTRLAGESIPPAAGEEDSHDMEALIVENCKLLASIKELGEKLQETQMELVQLQVEASIEEALTSD